MINIGCRVKFRFGNQRYMENFIYGVVVKAGKVCEVMSDSGLTYFVFIDKISKE